MIEYFIISFVICSTITIMASEIEACHSLLVFQDFCHPELDSGSKNRRKSCRGSRFPITKFTIHFAH